jgi:RNA polymerase sigma-70 factor (ECF subfamily)
VSHPVEAEKDGPGDTTTATREGDGTLTEEAELVEAARQGSQDAFRHLYERNVDRVYRMAHRMAGDSDTARDMTQEIFVRAWQSLDQFRGDAAFSTWLHTVAVSTGLNVIRRRDRHRKRERPMEVAHDVGGPRPHARPLLQDRLRAAVEELPEIYRVVFLMHDLEGYKHGEIAEALDVAVGTSKARLSRARARLRESLRDYEPEFA